MTDDPIIDEIRRIRHNHAAAHGFDLDRIIEDLKRREAMQGIKTVTLPPRPADRPIPKRQTG
jgi:hypothetical protein